MRIKDAESYMMNRKWTGMTQQTLEKRIDRHRSVFVCLSKATDYVSHQMLNERTRVGYLIVIIYSRDADVLSALAVIRQENTGMRESFQLDAIFLAPTCPVPKNQGNKRVAFDMTISATDGKKSRQDKTGVELRYHKKDEFLYPPQYQKDELVAYKTTKYVGKWKGAAGKPGPAGVKRNVEVKGPLPKNKLKYMISSMIVDATNNKEQPSTQD